MARNQDRYQGDLLRLMRAVAGINDFSHLERLDDGQEKAAAAGMSVEAMRRMLAPHQALLTEQEKAEECRRVAYDSRLRNQGVRKRLYVLLGEVRQLIGADNPQRRGYRLEKVVRELFALFDRRRHQQGQGLAAYGLCRIQPWGGESGGQWGAHTPILPHRALSVGGLDREQP